MIREFKYIVIEEVEKKPKTSVFNILNKKYGDLLGTVRWYGAWRGYVLDIQERTIWSTGCMNDVLDFVRGLMAARRKKK